MRPQKHSLTLRGHRTSVSLEDEFWRAYLIIVKEKDETINGLAAKIDEQRGTEMGLASAIRLYVLKYYQERDSN